MLKTKTIVLGLMALGSIPVLGQTSFAAPVAGNANGAPTQRHEKRTPQQRVARMARALNLSNDQQSRIVSILQNAQNQSQSLRGDTSLTPDQKKARHRAIKEQTKQNISAVLTQPQRDKLAQMEARHRQRREQNGAAPNGGNRAPGQ